MSDNRTQIVRARSEHLDILKTWFPDRESAYDWCGPQGWQYRHPIGPEVLDIVSFTD